MQGGSRPSVPPVLVRRTVGSFLDQELPSLDKQTLRIILNKISILPPRGIGLKEKHKAQYIMPIIPASPQ
jgi:hypothetical protein